MTEGEREVVIKHRRRRKETDDRYPIMCLEECEYLQQIDSSSILHIKDYTGR